MILNTVQVMERLDWAIQDGPHDLESDKDGQLIVMPQVWRWTNGTYHDHAEGSPEPE